MSRFIIETYHIDKQCTLKVVYFSHGYSERWMKNSKGQPNIPCVVLEDLVSNCLQKDGELKADFFDDYQKLLAEALYKRLIDKGKSNGAKEFARQRATDIGAALRAIIVVEDRPLCSPKVHCLNKNPQSPAAIYDESSGLMKVDDLQWHVGGKDHEDFVMIGTNDNGKFKKWWQQNKFLIWVSLFMLIVVPGLMIWGMLYIKEMAEQQPIAPASMHARPVLNDSTQFVTSLTDSLLSDSISTTSNSTISK